MNALLVRTPGGILLTAALCTLAAAPSAQAPSNRVVVRAVTNDGQPVLDLTQEEVTIRIDGRQREITSLELVEPKSDAAASAPPAAAAGSPLPPPYSTNSAAAAPSGGREFLITIDDEGIGTGREGPVRDAIKSLIARLSPADRVGLIAMKQGGVNVAPTTQHGAVIDALPKLTTIGSSSESELDLTCRTKMMIGNLGGFLEGAPPERVVVLFSPAMALQNTDAVRRIGQGGSSVPCELRADDLEALGKSASASAAQLFVVSYQEGLANPANLQSGKAGLENVAGVTRAEVIALAGSPQSVAEKINKAAGTYYIATLSEPAAGRRWDVRVNRDGVRATAGPAGGGTAVASGKTSPRDMVRTTAVYRDLPLRAAAFVSRQPGGTNLQVLALFESEDPAAKLNAASVVLFNEKGDGRAWNARSEDLQRAPVMAAMAATPGSYRMRVAATDGSGRAGATDVPVDVQLTTAGQMKLGSLVLGTDQNSPKLLFTAADQAVIGFLPVYDLPKDAQLSVAYEIRESETAAPLGTTDGRTIALPNDPTAQMVWGGFGLGPLQPGDYLMRAVVSVNGQEVAVVSRTLRKLK